VLLASHTGDTNSRRSGGLVQLDPNDQVLDGPLHCSNTTMTKVTMPEMDIMWIQHGSICLLWDSDGRESATNELADFVSIDGGFHDKAPILLKRHLGIDEAHLDLLLNRQVCN
jgi:hypothetical protein